MLPDSRLYSLRLQVSSVLRRAREPRQPILFNHPCTIFTWTAGAEQQAATGLKLLAVPIALACTALLGGNPEVGAASGMLALRTQEAEV